MDSDVQLLMDNTKRLEKALYKSSNLLGSLQELNQELETVYSNILRMRELTEENPSGTVKLAEELKERKIIPLLRKMESSLNSLKGALSRYEEQSLKANIFLENFRSQTTYSFTSHDAAIEFVEGIFSLFSVERVYFKPEFVGTFNLASLEKELGLEKSSATTMELPTSKLRELAEFTVKKEEPKSFRLEAPAIKLLWKNNKEVAVEADNPKIRRIDRLCKELGGTCSEG